MTMAETDVATLANPDRAVAEILLSGRAATVSEAEEIFLDEHLNDVVRLVASPISEAKFRDHAIIRLLLAHGSRALEDSIV